VTTNMTIRTGQLRPEGPGVEDTRAINHPDYREMMRKRKLNNRKRAKASRGAKKIHRKR
jgi:hypothetical protein